MKEANTIPKPELKRLRKEAESKFDGVQKQIREIDTKVKKLLDIKAGLEVEALRLQGEHRVLSTLLGDNPEKDPEQTLEANKKDDGNIQSQER